MSPESKKRCEELAYKNSPYGSCACREPNEGSCDNCKSVFDFKEGYQAGFSDPEANAEILEECERTLQTVGEIFARDHDKIIGLIGVTLNKLKAARGCGRERSARMGRC